MNRKPNFANVLLSILVLMTMVLSAAQPVNVSASTAPLQGDGIERGYHPQTGKLSFLGANPGNPIRVGKAMEGGLSPEARGLANLQMYAGEFGIRDVERELSVMKSSSGDGRQMVRYQQVFNGIPVMAGELNVNMLEDGSLLSINGEVSPELNLDTRSRLTGEAAKRVALQAIAEAYNLGIDELTVSGPELWIFDERLMQEKATQPIQLVWRMEISSENAPLRELVLVNAQTGKISLHFNQIDTAWRGEPLPYKIKEAKDDVLELVSLPASAPRGTRNAPLGVPDPSLDRFVATTGVDTGTCIDFANPCATINYAVGVAMEGDTIGVAEGTYTGSDAPMVRIEKSLNLSGGWNPGFDTQTGFTTIDGGNARQGITIRDSNDSVMKTVTINHFVLTRTINGGILNFENLTIRQSSLHDNVNAGIYHYYGTLNVLNTTISRNSMGVRNYQGIAYIRFATITHNKSDNGSGLSNQLADTYFDHTILYDNFPPGETGDCYNFPSGSLHSLGYNIVGTTCESATAQPTDHFGTDPLLSVFLPTEGYQPLRSDSPAIDAGNDAACEPTDQRGMPRLDIGSNGTACDIGAYEYTPPGTASQILLISGTGQYTRPDTNFPLPFSVLVLDNQSIPVSGVDVTFSAPASGPSGIFTASGSNVEANVPTDPGGIATSSPLTANSTMGNFTVNADAGLGTTIDFNLEIRAWYVSPTGDDANSCKAPAEPCATINAAITKAQPGETVFVSVGTYKGSSSQVVNVNKAIHLSGGWDSTFTYQSGLSIVDGEHARNGIYVYISPSGEAVIDHFGVINSNYGIEKTYGEVVVRNSAVYNNDYMGIHNLQMGMVLENVTVSSNLKTGIGVSGQVTITNVTISNNGWVGYSQSNGTVTITNTIIAGNSWNNPATRDCNAPGSGTLTSGGGNLIGDITGCTITPATNDQFGINPGLGVFLPSHGTHPLLPTSIAINNGILAACPDVDQRGIGRGGDPSCDSGAYEYVTPGTPVAIWIESGNLQRARVDTAYPLPLSAAVLDGQGNPVSGVNVTFSAPLSGPSGIFTSSSSNTEGPLTTDESGTVTTSTFTANSEYGLVTISAEAGLGSTVDFTLENLAWHFYVSETGSDTNTCKTPADPCATINKAISLALPEDVIYVAAGTYTGTSQTAVVSIQKSMVLSGGWDSTFSSRTGYSIIDGQNTRRGLDVSGVITVNLSWFDIRNSKGTGVSHYQSNLTITHSSIHDNYNDGSSGGGIVSHSGTLNISHSTIANNYAQSGGGIYSSSTTALNFVTVSNNSAKIGGGLYRYDGPSVMTVKNSILMNNTASESDPDCKVWTPPSPVSLGYNIVQTTCGSAQPTDQFNTDAKLGLFLPAQGYTPLLPDSPAIDNSDNTCGNEDQRGVASVDIPGRGVDGEPRCDAGAFEFIHNDGTPASVWVVDGNNQRTPPGDAFPEPLTAVVLDDQGNPVAGVDVNFSAPSSGASATFQATGNISEGPLTTNTGGTVTSSTLNANAISGAYSVTANGGTAGATTFTLTNAAWYVSPSGNDSNSCIAITEPCATINAARAKAVSGDTIFVTADVYTGTGTEVVIVDKPIHLSGGWNATFDSQTGYTTIDGEDARQGIVIEKEYVNTPILVVIDHFLVRNGYVGFGAGGGGIDNEYEILELSDSILEENEAPTGGGLYSRGSANLNHVIIRNNRAGSGGGVSPAGSGGGITTGDPMIIANSVITGNYAQGEGGGIHNASALTITNTSIVGNEALTNGGGLYTNTYHYSEDLVILNNVTLTENIAGARGGGILNDRASYLVIQPEIRNSIVAGNEALLSFDCVGTFIFKYSLIQDTAYCFGATAATNLNGVNPQLTGFLPSVGYAPLRSTSPARNAGNPATPGSGGTACEAYDQRGVSRSDTRCDMGAFEYTTPGSAARIVPITYGMRTPPNTTFDQPLQAAVLDAAGSPATGGMTLTFTAPTGGGPSGLFANGTITQNATVDGNGIATSSAFTANEQLGDYLVTVSGTGLTSGEIPLSNFAWYVRTDGNDSNDCTSPTTACLTIVEALEKANTDDSIYLAEGRYYIPDPFTTIHRRVKIIGSWSQDFSSRGGPTILDGQGIHSVLGNGARNTLIKRIMIEKCGNGISNNATLTLDQVSIIGCTGFGVHNGNDTGNPTLTILNSTISGNQMGGLDVLSGDVTVNNSTIAYNRQIDTNGSGGGIRNWGPGTVTISNTVVAYNNAYEGPDCYVYAPEGGKLISTGYNIISNTTGCTITAKTGDRFNTDPQLLPLIPPGYHPLKITSLAIGRGNPATCTSQDQRDLDRLANAKCDIGAYEYRAPGAAVELLAISPEVRRTGINSPFRNLLQAVALDAFGTPVNGVEVNFSAPTGGPSGTFQAGGGTAESLTTDAYGFATTSMFSANGEYGDYLLLAESPGLPGPVSYQMHNGAWLVVPVAGNDDNDCLSITTPCRSMEGVLKKQAFTNGDTVWTAAGNISGGTMTYIKKSAVFVGGWDPTFTTAAGASSIRAYYINNGDLSFTNYILGSKLENGGRLVLENSSIVGGSVENDYTGTMILSNVTATGNGTIESPIYNDGGTIYVFNSTITKNKARYTGGIYNVPYSNGVVYLKDTILAGNTATLATEKKTHDCLGKFISLGHNIIGTIGIYTTGTYSECQVTALETDIIGNNAHPYPASSVIAAVRTQDPVSGQWYHALKFAGAAIDGGNEALPGSGGNACPATDQLGTARPKGARCDIGAIEYKFENYPTDPLLVTYNARNSTSLPGTLLCESNNATCAATDSLAKNAHKYAFSAYTQYKLWHGRSSLDGNGMQIMSTIHYGSNVQNAFWNGFMLVYGDGYGFANADDVVAHELTHGVTQYESNLFYWYQSGAINESFSDIWGEAVDQTNHLGKDTVDVKWLLGEDITNLGAVRSMSKPSDFGDPDSITSPLYCDTGACLEDNGGVHTNSGVNNKAAYLLVSGGTFGGRTVSALGWSKTLEIYYEAQTNLLTSGADYLDLYNALYQACKNKIGVKGITLANCTEVRDATLAVKMNAQPATNFNPDTPFCPTRTYKVAPDVFFENFETGSDGWTMSKIKGQSAWGLSSSNTAGGKASLWADDSYLKTDSYAATKAIVLPTGSKPYLHFTHAFNFEAAGVSYYDGGVLEYSINNGTSWLDAKSLFNAGVNYKGTIISGSGNPLQGKTAFVGQSHGYVDSRYNLASLAGKTIRLRWRLGTDSTDDSSGWFVDDVRIFYCVSIPGVPTLQAPTNGEPSISLRPTFNWSDSTPDLFYYQLQLATNELFTENLVTYNNILVSTYTLTSDLNPGTQYFWRVRAFNAANKPSAWSAVWSFTTP